jgi:hypothetical protein
MTIEGRPRSRSFSSTPTFSSDLAKLKSSLSSTNNNSTTIVHSYKEAISIASTFDVLGNNSTLTPKLKLEDDDDWIALFQKSGAVTTTNNNNSSGSEGGSEGDSGNLEIHLEKFLRYCFDIAYKMPPSPSNRVLREQVKATGGNGGDGGGAVPSLQI